MSKNLNKILPTKTVEIYDLASGGMGVGKTEEGKIVFVPYSAPGDVLKIEIVEEDKKYSEGRIVEILTPSNLRITPICPAFETCGGCEWQHIDYQEQWKAKLKGVKHTLKRQGIETNFAWSEYPADNPWHYRNRIQLRGFRHKIGFFARGSKDIVNIEKCFIARNEINEKIAQVKAEGMKLFPYKVEIEVDAEKQVHITWNSNHSARGFSQVHDDQNLKLQTWVSQNAKEADILLDLYGGNGNLSHNLLTRFPKIHCVDLGSPEAESNNIRTFHKSDVKSWLDENAATLQGKSISVILDPPRDGLGPDLIPVIEHFKSLDIKQILVIGCDTNSWARILQRLERHGWQIAGLGALDFFPQTHHVECLANLSN